MRMGLDRVKIANKTFTENDGIQMVGCIPKNLNHHEELSHFKYILTDKTDPPTQKMRLSEKLYRRLTIFCCGSFEDTLQFVKSAFQETALVGTQPSKSALGTGNQLTSVA